MTFVYYAHFLFLSKRSVKNEVLRTKCKKSSVQYSMYTIYILYHIFAIMKYLVCNHNFDHIINLSLGSNSTMTSNILISNSQTTGECKDIETASVARCRIRNYNRRKDELYVLLLFPNQSSRYEFLTLAEIFVFVQSHTNSTKHSSLDETSELKGRIMIN
jgi:hypothetical protein